MEYACVRGGKKGCGGKLTGPTAELVNAPYRGGGSPLQSQQELMLGYWEFRRLKCRMTGWLVCFREVYGTWSWLSGGSCLSLSETFIAVRLSSQGDRKETQHSGDLKGNKGAAWVPEYSASSLVPVRCCFALPSSSCHVRLYTLLGLLSALASLGCRMGEGEPSAIWNESSQVLKGCPYCMKNLNFF